MQATNQHSETQIAGHREKVSPGGAEPAALAILLDGWMLGDATEQRETFDVLRRSLNEGRPDGYKLFS